MTRLTYPWQEWQQQGWSWLMLICAFCPNFGVFCKIKETRLSSFLEIGISSKMYMQRCKRIFLGRAWNSHRVSLDFAILHHNSIHKPLLQFFRSAKVTIQYFNDKIVDLIANSMIYRWFPFSAVELGAINMCLNCQICLVDLLCCLW